MARQLPPDEETFALKLTSKEHAFLRGQLEGLEESVAACLKPAPREQGYLLTFDQLEELAIHLTGLVRALPDEHRLINGIFRKVSDAMAVAAAQEAGADEDLKQVISLKKARDARATESEAQETERFLDELIANSRAKGMQNDVLPADAFSLDELRTMADELELPPELRRRLRDPAYRLTVADSMAVCKAVVGSLADDPCAESADLLRHLRDMSETAPDEAPRPRTSTKPAKKRGKKK
jgi:hypothetical protein